MREPENDPLQQLIGLLKSSSSLIVFTGAGMSTESGITDYRSKGGLWQRFQPVTIQEFMASADKRRDYWAYKKELYREMKRAKPNAGHLALARLEKAGFLAGVITQNIDGLHQISGIPPEKVIELHGTNRKTVCLKCEDETGWEETLARLEKGEDIPLCLQCGGLLKPATISFGQGLDSGVMTTASMWAQRCDLMLAVGSTLIVEPAASLPRIAKKHGSKLVIINLSETPLDPLADLLITEKAGKILKQVVEFFLGMPIE